MHTFDSYILRQATRPLLTAVVVALLLIVLQVTRRAMVVGVTAVVVDVALMLGLLVGWWDAIGGSSVPTAFARSGSPTRRIGGRGMPRPIATSGQTGT